MGPLLIWALRVVDDFAEDIMSAWEKAAEMTARAEATVTNRLGLARIKDYVDARRDRGEPIPSWVQSHGRTECIPYISALTGASMGQVDRVLRRGYRSEYARANLGPSPLKLMIKGRIDGIPWTKAIDFGDVDSLMRHLGTACFIVLEAQVPRNALTQRHLDLKNEFYEKVRARDATPDSQKRLRRQVTKLKELRAADAEELAALRADVEALVGALHQAQMENWQLRQRLAAPDPAVRSLPTQHRPRAVRRHP
ncbi:MULTISPECIES: hypothetical protein [Streptomyces]|uniref:hypothetical protein n=1 Tax=Streptomyces TaxID=1883 RepID=UPI001AC23F42|nr:hypothetical protein [Streptomyces sampsonii]